MSVMSILPEHIEASLNELYYELENLEDQYKKDRKKINGKISQLQSSCSHAKTKYCPDPSGNNDSCYVCQICGKEAKNL